MAIKFLSTVAVDTNVLYVDAAANKVGIGTTSPSQKLDVVGNIKGSGTLNVSSGTLSLPSIFFDNDTNTGFYRVSENVIGISSGGIGWQFSGASLQSGEITLKRQVGTATSPNYGFSSGYSGTGMFRPSGLNAVAFTTNNTEKMRITSAGNIGIGTTSPSAKLEVSGDLRISSDQTSLIKISNESNEDYFAVSQSTNNKPTLSLGDIDEQYGTLLTVDVESEEVVIFTNGTVKIGDNGFGNSTQFIVDDVNQKFTFTNGNVGIGTTSPSAKLDVAGGVKVANDTDSASANKEGTLRYRLAPSSPKSQSMVDMCMKTGPSSYAWVNIVTNTWSN